jgi:type I restriction enzyme M protein
MPANHTEIEKKLWASADELRANSHLKSSEYSVPVLGLIFLRFADQRFAHIERELNATVHVGSRRTIGKADYQARGVMYLPSQARFSYLLRLPESENIGKAINDAMKAIETENEELRGVLPTNYTQLNNDTLVALLKTFSEIPMDIEGDIFGKIYEYFLGKFAMSEGQKGGEFFTPTSIVKLIVEIIEPFQGRIFDPACGSGGMFVQSARFVQNHQQNPGTDISIYGQEKTAETVCLCRMNLAVHGLSGDIRQANSYYENVHNCRGRFDFVMANSASDARASELDIRRKLIEAQVVDIMISIGSNFFYTVTLPCTLWFFDRGKRNTDRHDKILFIDARHIFTQIDRAHRECTPEQIEFLANIVRLYRGEAIETTNSSSAHIQEVFPNGTYADVSGLCKVATLQEIEAQGWSINPGRYVGVAERAVDDFDFKEKLEELNEELEVLNAESRELEERISENVAMLLEMVE